jgi:hypothetical protein
MERGSPSWEESSEFSAVKRIGRDKDEFVREV